MVADAVGALNCRARVVPVWSPSTFGKRTPTASVRHEFYCCHGCPFTRVTASPRYTPPIVALDA
jgi:hypothetical protein